MKFKIITGFGTEDQVSIDESEVEKAFYCFLEKKDSIFSGGPVRGARITDVKPDYHATMGWNRGYKLGPDDYDEMKIHGIERLAQTLLSESKIRVQYFVNTKQEHLIGTKAEVLQVETPVSEEAKKLAESKRIK